MDVNLTCPNAKPHEELPLLLSARTHTHRL
jgi:hypothetical protein